MIYFCFQPVFDHHTSSGSFTMQYLLYQMNQNYWNPIALSTKIVHIYEWHHHIIFIGGQGKQILVNMLERTGNTTLCEREFYILLDENTLQCPPERFLTNWRF